MMRDLLWRIMGALAFATAMAALLLSPPGHRFERNAGLTALYALRGPVPVPPEAIVIALDQKASDWLAFHAADFSRVSDSLTDCLPETTRTELASLRSISDMPRGIHACLLAELGRRGARLVIFDILFSIETPDDEALAAAIAAGPPVILFERIRGAVEQGAGSGSIAPPQRVHPRPMFREPAAATASFLVNAPSGNFVEGYVPRLADFPDLASIPDVAAALFRGQAITDRALDEDVPIWLYGPPRTIPTWDLREVFERDGPRPLPDDLSDRAVFIGVSDPEFLGTKDHFKIPISDARENDIGGVELAAAAFLNILHGHELRRPAPAESAGVVAAFALAIALAVQVVGGWRGIAVAAATGALYAGAAFAAFSGAHVWLPFAVPLFAALPIAVFWALVTRYAFARRMVGSLAPRPVAERLLDRPGAAVRRIQTETATILFTDIVGSTRMGDTLSPTDYSEAINFYYQRANDAVEAHGGMVMEFMGDGIIAVFTESVTGPGHAAAGVAAALALSETIRTDAPRAKGDVPQDLSGMRLRMGIHSGTTATGGMGAEHRFNFKVLGDTVNTAARLEQLGKAFDDGERDVILVSEATRAASRLDEASFENLGEFALRGKRQPIRVSRLRDLSTIALASG
jgi:adenylate cyclase